MLIKKGTDLSKYGFELGADGYWSLALKEVESKGIEICNYIIVDGDNNLYIQSQVQPIASEGWSDTISDMGDILTKMIKDGVVV